MHDERPGDPPGRSEGEALNPNEIKREWFEKDYYKDLGVAKNASAADIKKAYRKLAQKHHPDTNAGNTEAEERFKEVSSAYDVLGDETKRKQYDEVREMASSGRGYPGGGFPGGAGASGWPGGGGYQQVNTGDLGDIFGDLFGNAGGRGGGAGGARRQQPRRGADLETHVQVSFEDSIHGTMVPVSFRGAATCPRCKGNGAESGTKPVSCPSCGGSGQVVVNQGPFSMAQACPTCGGSGRYIETPCIECHGSGHIVKKRKLNVKIPAGVKDGARIKLAQRGEPGPPGSKPGDLYVVVKVAAHPVFGRKGNNLTVELPVDYADAALGAQVPVPTLNGPVTLKVPAGTPSGKTFRVKGKGVPTKNGAGDLLATVTIDVPKRVSKDEKELLKQLQELRNR